MPIANYKPDAQLPTKPNLPKIEPKGYVSIVKDDNETPLKSLIAYMEGAPWSGTYYSQVVSAHNDIREIDPGSPDIYQQYQKIMNFEIRVSSALTDSYDSTTGITTVSGGGLVYGSILPNISDYFVSDTGDDKTGVFRLTNVERKNFNRDSAFYIEYDLVGFVELDSTTIDELNSKTIRTYYYSKDRLLDGLQPLMKEEDHIQTLNLKDIYREIVNYYYKTFFNRKYMTLVIPGQSHGMYDSFLAEYIMKIVDTFDAYDIKNVKQIPTDHDVYLNQPQLWSLMLNRDYDDLSMCNQKMGLTNTRMFNNSTYIRGLAFSNMDYVVYPDTPDVSAIVASSPDVKFISLEEVMETTNVNGTVASLITGQYVTAAKTYQLIHTVLLDDFYVLSENFYTNSANQSVLEILVKDYLKRQSIDIKMLNALVAKFKHWGRLEQFYYGPILMTLIKEADRASYT